MLPRFTATPCNSSYGVYVVPPNDCTLQAWDEQRPSDDCISSALEGPESAALSLSQGLLSKQEASAVLEHSRCCVAWTDGCDEDSLGKELREGPSWDFTTSACGAWARLSLPLLDWQSYPVAFKLIDGDLFAFGGSAAVRPRCSPQHGCCPVRQRFMYSIIQTRTAVVGDW